MKYNVKTIYEMFSVNTCCKNRYIYIMQSNNLNDSSIFTCDKLNCLCNFELALNIKSQGRS